MKVTVTHRGPSVGRYKSLGEVHRRTDGAIIVQYERNDRPHRVPIPADQCRGLNSATAMEIARWAEGSS